MNGWYENPASEKVPTISGALTIMRRRFRGNVYIGDCRGTCPSRLSIRRDLGNRVEDAARLAIEAAGPRAGRGGWV